MITIYECDGMGFDAYCNAYIKKRVDVLETIRHPLPDDQPINVNGSPFDNMSNTELTITRNDTGKIVDIKKMVGKLDLINDVTVKGASGNGVFNIMDTLINSNCNVRFFINNTNIDLDVKHLQDYNTYIIGNVSQSKAELSKLSDTINAEIEYRQSAMNQTGCTFREYNQMLPATEQLPYFVILSSKAIAPHIKNIGMISVTVG